MPGPPVTGVPASADLTVHRRAVSPSIWGEGCISSSGSGLDLARLPEVFFFIFPLYAWASLNAKPGD